MEKLRRRGFLGGIGGSLASIFAMDKIAGSKTANAGVSSGSSSPEEIMNPNDVKLNVKLVFASLIHSEPWEGPCRASAGASGDEERANHRASFKSWIEEFQKNNAVKVNMLKPELVEWVNAHKEFRMNENEIAKLNDDKDEVDVYLVSSGTAAQGLAVTVGKRYNKPVVMMTSGLQSIDASAHLRARGFEGYAVLDYNELNRLMNLLRTRKVLRQTNFLLITNMPMPAFSEVSSIWDFDDLGLRFGIGSKIINYNVMADEMNRVMSDKDEQNRAQNLADKLIKNAMGTYLDKKYVYASAQYYYTIKNLMNKFRCNAFSIECWEFCTSRLPMDWKIVPCLTHTLLKDQGYSSACQADISCLLAIRIMQTLAGKTAFMGNQFMDMETELVKIGHSVPGLKMGGYDKPDLPYDLRNFCESGFGTKVMINFSDYPEKTVTLLNLDPLGKKLMVAKAELAKTVGFNEGSLIACSLQAHLKFPDPRAFMYKQADFGTHLAMVYGDYTKEIKQFGEIMKMEVVDCS